MRQFSKQQGVVLIISLIALVAISLAGLALMRTVDTSNVISGNVTFNEAANQIADVGAEIAYTEVMANTADNAFSCQNVAANCPKNAAGDSYMYPNVARLDAETKLPAIAPMYWSDSQPKTLPGETLATASYSYKYLIERMCGRVIRTAGATAVASDDTTNLQEPATFSKCRASPLYDTSGAPISQKGKLFYRVTVQVSGPRNTRVLAQYFFGIIDTVK
ncbi:MAG: hypothetical protein PHP85_07500 [Gallionella sp.]|nr:hypothetical protein [Gallionella sp.]